MGPGGRRTAPGWGHPWGGMEVSPTPYHTTRLSSPQPAPCRRKEFPSRRTQGQGAGLAVSMWLRAIPSSPAVPLAVHDIAAIASPMATASPSRGSPTPGAVPQDRHVPQFPPTRCCSRTAGWGGPRHTWDTIGSPMPEPSHPVCCPPAPPWRDGLTTEPQGTPALGRSPAPDAIWGGRSPSQLRRQHASRKTYFTAVTGSSSPSVPGPG